MTASRDRRARPRAGRLLALLLLAVPPWPGPAVPAESPGRACGLCLPASSARPVPPVSPAPAPRVTREDLANPHGRAARCASCHLPGTPESAATFQAASCVDCHDPRAHLREIHPTDLAGDNPKAPAFAGARLAAGRSTCLTCHEINCDPHTSYRVARENRSMLRGGPWPRETDFCYQCHERKHYQPVHPHAAGPESGVCWYCHAEGSGEGAGSPGIALQLPQAELCMKCHKDVKHEREHVGRSVLHNRLRMDTAAALRRFQAESGAALPLGPEGAVACATCHSPNPACSRGATPAPKLLRAARERICYACHDL